MTMANNTTASVVNTGDVSLSDWDDATWILTSSFIIFTMQSGFGLLEAGSVGTRNEVNIMVKNAVDVIYGGLTYWVFGYGLSYGMDPGSNGFVGWGHFCVDSTDPIVMGSLLPSFVFQLSFATTATTIVSGAMAERTKLTAYIVFSLFNTVVYCIPAHWVWADNGFLKQLGALDFAGSGVVHMLGAVSALVAALLLGPRRGRYEQIPGVVLEPGNPANALVGTFMLWWGWLAFNCGSTYGISGGKWILATRSAVTTLNASMAGGFVGILYTYIKNKGKFLIDDIINSILGGLVAITASCAMVRPWEALVVGGTGASLTLLAGPLLDRLRVDDPVSAVAVHGAAGAWGMLVVGLLAEYDPLEDITGGRAGLLKGGGPYLLGVQLLTVVCIAAWSASISFIILFSIDKCIGLRMSEEDEILGCDFVEHDIRHDKTMPRTHVRPFSGRVSRCSSVSPSTIQDVQKRTDASPKTSNNNGSARKDKDLSRELTELSVDSLARHILQDSNY